MPAEARPPDAVPPDDVERIVALVERAFDPQYGEAWTRRQLSDALLLGNCRYRLIDADGACAGHRADAAAGFYLSRSVVDEEELLLFAIHPAHRGRGLGHRLLEAFIAAARERGMRCLFLEMRRGNPAEALYAAHGFLPVGLRRDYYRMKDGRRIDAISYRLVLEGAGG